MKCFLHSCIVVLFFVSCQDPQPGSSSITTEDTGVTQADSASTPDTSYDRAARLIIPGTGIGLTKIGENTDTVIARFGKPDRSDAAMGKAWLIWTSVGSSKTYETAVFTARNMSVGNEESLVRQIRITSPFFHTADSLQTGMSLNRIIGKMPGLQKQTTTGSAGFVYDLPSEGIGFETDRSGNCTAILVHGKNKPVQVYVPVK